MDYKKIIKSRAVRLKILELLSFIPDEPMLKLQYRIKTRRKLNLKDPQRLTEKIQWYKLHYKDPLMIQCVDKYDVREYVKGIGLEEILIPCFGVYDRVEDIDWDALPDRFVMKDTLGGGGNSVVIVTDKKTADIAQLQETARKWTERNVHIRGGGREWPYYSGKRHRIVFETYVDSDPAQGGLIEYKFLCFNGKVECLFVIADRILGEEQVFGGFGVYSPEFERLPVQLCGEGILTREMPKPDDYEAFREIAQQLAKPFPEVRIDLYHANGKIMFGEMTFFDNCGYTMYDPDIFDYQLGEKFILPKKKALAGKGENFLG